MARRGDAALAAIQEVVDIFLDRAHAPAGIGPDHIGMALRVRRHPHVVAEEAGLDVKSLLVEYSGLFRNAREAAGAHEAGELAELSVNTGKLWTVARLVSPDYFMAVALRPEGNLGKARFLLRITAPKVRSEL